MQNEKTELNALYHYGIKGQKWGIRKFEDLSENQVESEKNNLDAMMEMEKNRLNYKQSIQLGKQEVAIALNRDKIDKKISNKQENTKRKKYATIGALAIIGLLVGSNIAKRSIKASSKLKQSDDSDSLTHYGTKGMRWGVRKAYDEDPVTSSKTRKYELDLQKIKEEKHNPVNKEPNIA